MNQGKGIPIGCIQINDSYWNRYIRLIREVAIPYQWEILNDRVAEAHPSHCLENYRIAAGQSIGERRGTVFQDTDATKWLEAVAYTLATHPDAELEALADEVIGLLGRAQSEDGYLNTYYMQMDQNARWSNLLEGHELYCAGHLIEAAVAYAQATGKKALLDIAVRFADLLCEVFGGSPAQHPGYPGHPEIELALVRLFAYTGERKYLTLARHFLDVRGQQPNFFLQELKRPGFQHVPGFEDFDHIDLRYAQAHMPIWQQSSAEGHAVRAVYLYSAMVDVACLYGEDGLLEQCKLIWNNLVQRRMYLTGGIGSSCHWERFTIDYDLPGDYGYSETCASIGLAMFGLRMARATKDAAYMDVVERALYNVVRAGISLEGTRYFYVNPLEVWPASCMDGTSKQHVKPVRQMWFDTACCPTNIARTLTNLGEYLYSVHEEELYINLFLQHQADILINGQEVALEMETDYPRSGRIFLRIHGQGARFVLLLRLPAFAQGAVLYLNSKPVEQDIRKGYLRVEHFWEEDQLELCFAIHPQLVFANPLVRANAGKTALVRGPEVFCFEEVDNGANLSALAVDSASAIEEAWDENLLGGAMRLFCRGKRQLIPCLESTCLKMPEAEDCRPVAVPYGSWGNRVEGEMAVWMRLC